MYTHLIQWTEKDKFHRTVTKEFKTTRDAFKIHQQLLQKNPEVLSWKVQRIKYDEITKVHTHV